ncbi:MAG: hypothetical protein ACD_23C00277G0008 [uncultured bacterium]|nr:MAG: hypothetical protein ACD_23C00277G0008 [uncultured bacterium]
MKLTDTQILVRSAFREEVIDQWIVNGKPFMFNIKNRIAERLNMTVADVFEVMQSIPSIGFVSDTMPINVWTAKYFKLIANAMWEGKSRQQVLALWAKTKRTTDSNKLSAAERSDLNSINRDGRKLRAVGELRNNMPDRWGETDWSKCK